jgi:hypothetical protein
MNNERRSGTRIAGRIPTRLRVPEKCWVCCQATVVRVEDEGTEFGVAAQIRRMDILPEVAI